MNKNRVGYLIFVILFTIGALMAVLTEKSDDDNADAGHFVGPDLPEKLPGLHFSEIPFQAICFKPFASISHNAAPF